MKVACKCAENISEYLEEEVNEGHNQLIASELRDVIVTIPSTLSPYRLVLASAVKPITSDQLHIPANASLLTARVIIPVQIFQPRCSSRFGFTRTYHAVSSGEV